VGSVSYAVEAGVFVLGMHRSGTSAVTRLISLLGPRTPPEEDLVQPTHKNPKGYWESEALVNFNERVLAAVGSDIGCPLVLRPGWEDDSRLDALRREAPQEVRTIFPTTPWVWKDPRHCLVFSFWRQTLDVRPVVVLVNRNPLEITASAQRLRSDRGRVYGLALWERYLRQALEQIAGLPVLVARYETVLSDPHAWSSEAHGFLVQTGVPGRPPSESEVASFIDADLRHAEFTRAELLSNADVSDAQRALFIALEELEGTHAQFVPPVLPDESATTEALLAERRRVLDLERELELERTSRWSWKLRRSRYAAPAGPLYARGRRLLRAFQNR
jgi:hypothetical protein